AGAFAAFTVDLLVYPLDTVKTRFQSPDYKKIYYDASKNAINRRLLLRGLYQGVGSVILITIPSSGAFFTSYEAVKGLLSRANPTLSGSSSPLIPLPFIHSAASATAELVSCFILTPAEPSATIHALKQFKTPSQLWRGYTALAARNLPFTAMQFPMFEHMKEVIKVHRKKSGTYTGGLGETALITAVSAGSAGSIAAVLTTPVDVVKTRIMLSATTAASEKDAMEEVARARKEGQPLDKLASHKGVTKNSSFTVAREVLKESGVKGLFRGVILRAAWTALGSGLYLGVYESGRAWLGDRHASSGENS
ncbi:S-adenosylmethionine mitochondrial carrier protein, partial [Lachnellula subtilissima]